MAKFLNTRLLSNWIERLIDETERDAIISITAISAASTYLTRFIKN